MLEAVAQMCSSKKVFLEILQNRQENISARAPPVAASKYVFLHNYRNWNTLRYKIEIHWNTLRYIEIQSLSIIMKALDCGRKFK